VTYYEIHIHLPPFIFLHLSERPRLCNLSVPHSVSSGFPQSGNMVSLLRVGGTVSKANFYTRLLKRPSHIDSPQPREFGVAELGTCLTPLTGFGKLLGTHTPRASLLAMARPTPYSRPQASNTGFRNSIGSTYIQPSPLPATVHRNTMPIGHSFSPALV
jgi:hypothetical protein